MRVPSILIRLLLSLFLLALGLRSATAQSLVTDVYGDADKALLSRAFGLAEQRRWDDAVATARQVGNPLPAKLFTWWRLVSADNRMKFRDYASFMDGNPDWPRRASLLIAAEKAMDDTVADATVIEWFARHEPVSADGRIHLGDAYLARGNREKAAEWFRYVWQHDEMGDGKWREFYNSRRTYLRQSDTVARVDRLIWNGQATQAWYLLSLLPAGERALAEARLALLSDRRDVDMRIARVPPALRGNPGLTYERATWRRRHGLDDGWIELLLEAAGDLGPRPDKWWTERQAAARNLLARGEFATAYRIAAGHGQEPGTAAHAEAEWLAGWIALRYLSRLAEAGEHFHRLYDAVSYPISRARGAYWRGRVSAAQGQANHATRWFRLAALHPTTFYGQLATEALAEEPVLRLQPSVVPRRDNWAGFRRRDVVAAAELLGEFGQRELFRTFILQLAEDAKRPVEQEMIGGLARHFLRYDIGVRVAKVAVRTGLQIVEHGYPLFQLPPVEAEQALVFAIMRQESEFRVEATSPVGARGLMQLMPGTAREVARSLGLGYSGGRLLSDPVYNVRLGSAYIREMIDAFDGSYLLAIAAYNAGPGRVRQWLSEIGDPRAGEIDPVYWVESIPFDETRNYVQRVLEGLQVYRQRLAEKPTLSQLSMDLTRSNTRRQ